MADATSQQERRIGLEGYSTPDVGVGGLLKVRVKDFRVEEKARNHPLDPKGRFTVARITLTNWETNRFVNRLARGLKMSRNRIWFSGTKDKRAVTTQLMVIDTSSDKVAAISIPDVEIRVLGRSHQKLKLGQHMQNQFTIITRGCAHLDGSPMTPSDAEKMAEKILSDMQNRIGEGLFPNWIGPQRFGGARAVTADVGRFVLDSDYEAAVNAYLGTESTSEDEEATSFRRMWRDGRDPVACLEAAPQRMGYEKGMLRKLVQNNENWVGAFTTLPNNLQLMCIHAVQSILFNKTLAARLDSELHLAAAEIGDIVAHVNTKGGIDTDRLVTVDELTQSRISRNCALGRLAVTGPLPGSERILAGHHPGRLESAVIAAAGLSEQEWKVDRFPRLSSKGSRRSFVSRFSEMSVESVGTIPHEDGSIRWKEGPGQNDRWHPEGANLKCRFNLPPGSYATILMRELMRSPLSHY